MDRRFKRVIIWGYPMGKNFKYGIIFFHKNIRSIYNEIVTPEKMEGAIINDEFIYNFRQIRNII
jgi:hypothetical protein